MVTTTLTVQSHLFADDHADAMAALGAMEAAERQARKRDSAAAMMIALRTKPMPQPYADAPTSSSGAFCCGEPRPRRVGHNVETFGPHPPRP